MSRVNRIYEGLLDKQPFFVKVLDKSHLPKVLDLQEVVYDALPNKDILQPLSEEEFLVMLEGSGLIIGAFVGETLIAFRAVVAQKSMKNI